MPHRVNSQIAINSPPARRSRSACVRRTKNASSRTARRLFAAPGGPQGPGGRSQRARVADRHQHAGPHADGERPRTERAAHDAATHRRRTGEGDPHQPGRRFCGVQNAPDGGRSRGLTSIARHLVPAAPGQFWPGHPATHPTSLCQVNTSVSSSKVNREVGATIWMFWFRLEPSPLVGIALEIVDCLGYWDSAFRHLNLYAARRAS